MDKNVSKKISVYNYVFTLFIVIYHWKNFYELIGVNSSSYTYLYNFFDMFGTIALAGFFATSAYLLYFSADNTADILKKMKRRLFSLFVPILIWNTLAFIFQFVTAKLTESKFEISLMKILLGYTFAMFDGPLWYLLAMIMLMCVAPLVIKLKNRKTLGTIVLVAVSAVSIALSTLLNSDESLIKGWFGRFFRYMPAYSLGVYFALNFKDIIANPKYKQKTLALIALPVLVLVSVYHILGINNTVVYWLVLSLIPAVCWLAVPTFCFEKTKITFRLKTSFFIYAMHNVFFIPIFNAFTIRFLAGRTITMPVACLIHIALFALLLAMVYVFAFVSKKILPKGIYNALSGGRG